MKAPEYVTCGVLVEVKICPKEKSVFYIRETVVVVRSWFFDRSKGVPYLEFFFKWTYFLLVIYV